MKETDFLLINEVNIIVDNIKYSNIKGYKIHALFTAR